MKRIAIALFAAVIAATPVWAGENRTLHGAVDAGGIESVRLDAGVGDIEITATEDRTDIAVEVRLKPRRGGFFSSMKKAQREVDEAELRMESSRGVLRLEIETGSDDRHFEEQWTIELPTRLAFDLDLGVGDVFVTGLAGAFSADIGVGEVEVELVSGDIEIEIGVGDASIVASAADYGSVAGSGGVGDAKLTVHGEKISSSGFVGHSAEWSGAGDHVIDISVGVGDARVTLE